VVNKLVLADVLLPERRPEWLVVNQTESSSLFE
jgi:hypothetical protein